MSHIETELALIADQLDWANAEVESLYKRRLDLWRRASAKGVPSVALARASRVQSVTVRSLLHRDRMDNG